MKAQFGLVLLSCVCVLGFGCSSSDDNNAGTGGTGGAAGMAAGTAAGTSGTTGGTAGTMVAGTTGGTAGAMATGGAGGMGVTGGMSATGGNGGMMATGGMMAAGGMGGDTPDAGEDASVVGNGSDLTGMLGALGAVKPVVSGWVTTNGLETLIYLSSSELTCAQMMTMGTPWLSTLPAGTQVIEIVVRGTASVGTTNVGFLAGEINYAEGSKSSSFEVNADSGSIMFTTAMAMGTHEGTITATYPMGMLSGTFHAEWCEGGQEY